MKFAPALALLLASADAAGLRSISPLAPKAEVVDVGTLSATEGPQANDLEDSLMALMESGAANTPELATFVRSIQSLLDSQMKPKILENRRGLQAIVQRSWDQFASCAATTAAKQQELLRNGTARAQDLATQHAQCRRAQAQLAAESQACETDAASARTVMQSACSSFTDFQNTAAATCSKSGGENYLDYATRLQKFFAEQILAYGQRKKACDDATASSTAKQQQCAKQKTDLAARVSLCNQLQDQMDSFSCNLAQQAKDMCGSNDNCYASTLAAYQNQVRTVRPQEAGIKTEFEAVLRLQCLTETFARADEDRAGAITACRNADHSRDVAVLNINYPDPPAKSTCAVPDGLAGSPSYAQTQYASLPALAPAKTCTASCCSSRIAGNFVEFTNFFGTLSSPEAGRLTLTQGNEYSNGAVSVGIIQAGELGGFSFRCPKAAGAGRRLVLGMGSRDSLPTPGYTGIQYMVHCRGDFGLNLYEDGIGGGDREAKQVFVPNMVNADTVFEVALNSLGQLEYRRNGNPIYTSRSVPKFPLRVLASFAEAGSTADLIRWTSGYNYGTTRQTGSFIDFTNFWGKLVQTAPGQLTMLDHMEYQDGAVSAQAINAGETGGFSFRQTFAGTQFGVRMCIGFGSNADIRQAVGSPMRQYEALFHTPFFFHCTYGQTAMVYEIDPGSTWNSKFVGAAGTCAPNRLIELAVNRALNKYQLRIDGSVVYTSQYNVQYPVRVHASFAETGAQASELKWTAGY